MIDEQIEHVEPKSNSTGSLSIFSKILHFPQKLMITSLQIRSWVLYFITLTITTTQLRFIYKLDPRRPPYGLPRDPFTYLGVLIGSSGFIMLLWWPLWSFFALYAGPIILGGKGRYSDSMIVMGTASIPTAIVAALLLVIETVAVFHYNILLRQGQLLQFPHVFFSLMSFLNFFLTLWLLLATVLGVKLVHKLSLFRSILGYLALPVLMFALIGLINFYKLV